MDKKVYIKLILIGQSGIGKTHLACRYREGEQPFGIMGTIGVDCYSKTVDVDGKMVILNIWDTAGQERYRSLTRSFYTNSDCAFICFSLCDISSMRQISSWKKELEEKGITCIYLIGTQNDSRQRLPESVINTIIESYKMPVFYTSSYTGENVKEAFESIVRLCLDKIEKNSKNDSFYVDNSVKEDRSQLCQCLLS